MSINIVFIILGCISLAACVYTPCTLRLAPRNHRIFTICSINFVVIGNALIHETLPNTARASSLQRKLMSPRSTLALPLFAFPPVLSSLSTGAILIIALLWKIERSLSPLHGMIIPHLFLILIQMFCEGSHQLMLRVPSVTSVLVYQFLSLAKGYGHFFRGTSSLAHGQSLARLLVFQHSLLHLPRRCGILHCFLDRRYSLLFALVLSSVFYRQTKSKIRISDWQEVVTGKLPKSFRLWTIF